ncbi:armadillo-type protein [Crassisporium funariophilum]|nr:armadillo-type protein [Crassisporium funariophilum]
MSAATTRRPPNHIPLPPPQSFNLDPADPASPLLLFYTPPSSPAPSPSVFYTPPTSPFRDLVPQPAIASAVSQTADPSDGPMDQSVLTDDRFPVAMDLSIDLALDDDGLLSTLEKIYLYSRSKAAFHRVFIAHALPAYLQQVTPQEAVEYVLPLLSGLAMDDDEPVKEALAAELVPVIWWFFTHCQIIPDDLRPEEAYASSSTTVTISVQAFTPILGTLLLSSNPLVGGAARFAVVDLLSRMKKADDRELGSFRHLPTESNGRVFLPWEIAQNTIDADDEDEDETPLTVGLFGPQERAMFTQEILQQVVIGMGRLDVDIEIEVDQPEDLPSPGEASRTRDNDRMNPYFPPLASNFSPQSPSNFSTWPPADSSPSRTRLGVPGASYSPGTEFPNGDRPTTTSARSSSPASVGRAAPEASNSISNSPHLPPDADWDDVYDGDDDTDDEQAAVGRLSSMSLMAAVTASGTLQDDTQRAFVTEVERVGRDRVYWVRREASFALGALAKVVPEEIVGSSLLPLFNSLRWDAIWHVRHSALFALPAIIARLSPSDRRVVALETMVALSADQNATVRSGVLEALGEVLHTFHGDPDGPPDELLRLFLGRKEDRRVRDGQQELDRESQNNEAQTPLESFYTDSKRPLICAFNFPAVALTLGGRRWGEIREEYLDIASNPAAGVRRTLLASLGELAKIIGAEHAQKDLVDLWWTGIRSEEEEVRTKAVESLHDLLAVVGKTVGRTLVQGLLTVWNQGILRGWRERELIEKSLISWVDLLGIEIASLARSLVLKGLEDSVAAVRETAIITVSQLCVLFASQKAVVQDIRSELRKLATSPIYRRRMTFIACQQSIALPVGKDGEPSVILDDDLLLSVSDLAKDEIEGVRIGVARFAGAVYGNLLRHSRSIPSVLDNLVRSLSQDSSHEVQSYISHLSFGVPAGDSDASLGKNSSRSRRRLLQIATFSRPPPPVSQGQHRAVSPQLSPAAETFGMKSFGSRTISGQADILEHDNADLQPTLKELHQASSAATSFNNSVLTPSGSSNQTVSITKLATNGSSELQGGKANERLAVPG